MLGLAGCGGGGSSSGGNTPAKTGNASISIGIKHQQTALLANYKLQDSGPEDIKIINNAKTIQEWHSSGDAQSIENDTKEFLAAGTYTVTANTYVLGTGASALTCTPDNATQTKTLGNNDN